MTTSANPATTATITVHRTNLTVNPSNQRVRQAQRDARVLHTMMMEPYRGQMPRGTDAVREQLGVLYAAKRTHTSAETRGAGILTGLLVQSRATPDWATLVTSGAVALLSDGPVTETFTEGEPIRVRTWLNPTRRPHAMPHVQSANRTELTNPNDIADWVRRKMLDSGCEIHDDTLQYGKSYRLRADTKNSHWSVALRPYLFTATIVDPCTFTEALLTGVGSGKSYGAGLLHIERCAII